MAPFAAICTVFFGKGETLRPLSGEGDVVACYFAKVETFLPLESIERSVDQTRGDKAGDKAGDKCPSTFRFLSVAFLDGFYSISLSGVVSVMIAGFFFIASAEATYSTLPILSAISKI